MDDHAEARRRKVFVLCAEIFGTDERAREERLELAQFLLRRDVTSYSELDDAQRSRLLDALEGWQLISALLEMRPWRGGGTAGQSG